MASPKSERDVVAVIRGRRGLLRRKCCSGSPDRLEVADYWPFFPGFPALFSEVDGGESGVSVFVRAVSIRNQRQLQVVAFFANVDGIVRDRDCDECDAVLRGKRAGSSELQQVNS